MLGVEGLCPHAHAIHASFVQDGAEFRRDRFRVAFNREFAVSGPEKREIEACSERFQQLNPEFRLQQARSAPADEDGFERRAGIRGKAFEFGLQSSQEPNLPVLRIDDAVKVAVMALMEAKWDMDVQTAGIGVRSDGSENVSH